MNNINIFDLWTPYAVRFSLPVHFCCATILKSPKPRFRRRHNFNCVSAAVIVIRLENHKLSSLSALSWRLWLIGETFGIAASYTTLWLGFDNLASSFSIYLLTLLFYHFACFLVSTSFLFFHPRFLFIFLLLQSSVSFFYQSSFNNIVFFLSLRFSWLFFIYQMFIFFYGFFFFSLFFMNAIWYFVYIFTLTLVFIFCSINFPRGVVCLSFYLGFLYDFEISHSFQTLCVYTSFFKSFFRFW